MTNHTPVFKDLFPQAAPLFEAAEDNSRTRCSSALAYLTLSAAEKSAAVHIAAESGSYEAMDFMLQSFAKTPQAGFKVLEVTRKMAQNDPALGQVLDRYQDALHDQAMKMIDATHTLVRAARQP